MTLTKFEQNKTVPRILTYVGAILVMAILAAAYIAPIMNKSGESTPASAGYGMAVPVSDLPIELKESGFRRAFLARPTNDHEVMRGFNRDEPFQVVAHAKDTEGYEIVVVQSADSRIYPAYSAEVSKIQNGKYFRYHVNHPGEQGAIEIVEEKDIDFSKTDYDNVDP